MVKESAHSPRCHARRHGWESQGLFRLLIQCSSMLCLPVVKSWAVLLAYSLPP